MFTDPVHTPSMAVPLVRDKLTPDECAPSELDMLTSTLLVPLTSSVMSGVIVAVAAPFDTSTLAGATDPNASTGGVESGCAPFPATVVFHPAGKVGICCPGP